MRSYEVVAAIIRFDGKILATQRSDRAADEGWEFPGGKIEVGETREQALVREIREELAADLAIESFFHTVEHTYDEYHLTMHCYLCTLPEGRFKLLEHRAARWLGADELDEVAWLPADAAVVERLKAERAAW